MKNILKLTAIFIFLAIFITSCSKDDNSNTGNVTEIIEEGDWKIVLFNEDGNDELYHFTGYSFVFNNGTVTASKNSSTITGTYSNTTDSGNNKLILDFGTSQPFDELNDDWHILEQTNVKIRLEDVSGGNGGTDLLTFEKL
ncbi:MAG: hypothetical protein PHT69_10245 [Bacteroidales bacterium]|nr:hypothetical protein [Bacteroidales bacterium]